MPLILRLLRIAGLSLAGLLVSTVLAVFSGGAGWSIFPGMIAGLTLWVAFPVLGHLKGRHALALDGWASLLLGVGSAFLIAMKLLQGIRC